MTEVPKIVHQRLRTAGQAAEGAHPEADVLAAFAEQALSAAERDRVLEHLALCGDCREVVVLALPATELTPAPVEQEAEVQRAPAPVMPPGGWFAWANLRWAALAAGIAVAVLVARPGLERWAKPNAPVSMATSQAARPNGPAAPTAQLASGSAAEQSRMEAPKAETKQEFVPEKAKPAPFAAAARGSDSGTVIADNLKKGAAADKLESAPPPAPLALAAPGKTTEAVEVSGATGVQTTVSSLDSALMARNEAPAIAKAKPPLEEMVSEEKAGTGAQTQMKPQANNAMFATRAAAPLGLLSLKPNAMWMIKAGVLERSLDGGQSWQTAVKADHPLSCYAKRGQEVWAGGQAGTLMQSTDEGATWSVVKVSFKGQPLSSDVTSIDLKQDTAEIVLATATNETWSSADGGKTWQKK